jgi:uncharacterized protein (TIGR02246 family)
MNSDEQAIRELISRWHSATGAGDVDSVLKLMSEDVVFLVAGKPPMRGRGAFEQGLRQLLRSHRIESSGEIQEIAISGDLAYSWTALKVRITPLAGGDSNSRSGFALTVLRKQANGSWVVTRDANLLPTPS